MCVSGGWGVCEGERFHKEKKDAAHEGKGRCNLVLRRSGVLIKWELSARCPEACSSCARFPRSGWAGDLVVALWKVISSPGPCPNGFEEWCPGQKVVGEKYRNLIASKHCLEDHNSKPTALSVLVRRGGGPPKKGPLSSCSWDRPSRTHRGPWRRVGAAFFVLRLQTLLFHVGP